MQLFPFSNSSEDHDFTVLSDTIEAYFPVKNGERLTAETMESWPGFHKTAQIIQNEFGDRKAYKAKWGKLTARLKNVLKKTVLGYPDFTSGAFFGEVVITQDKQTDFIRQKSLQFYVSNIGPFFSIHGCDSSTAILQIESASEELNMGYFEAIHALTVSPVFEYKEMFTLLEDELRAYFPGYAFVPYDVGMSTLKNISIADDMDDPRHADTIYEAIFGRKAVHQCLTRGDENYGMDDWLKPLDQDEQFLLDLIRQHILHAPKEKTIHKVWKFESSRRLDTFQVSRPLTFGVELFTVIDLTDKPDLIVITEKRGAPGRGNYTLKNDIIEMDAGVSFRIVEVSEDTLTLNLMLNFGNETAAITGEVMELKLRQLKALAG